MKDIITKKCSKCGENKFLDEFHRRIKSKDGLASWCKDCKHIVRQAHYLLHKEEQIFEAKKWRKEHETKEMKRERHKKEYYYDVEKSRERWRGYNKKFRDKNPEKITQYLENYRAMRKVGGGRVSANEWKSLKDFYENKCLCCGRDDVKLTQDHVVPLSKGGLHNIGNIQPLCKSCNSSKKAKIIDFR